MMSEFITKCPHCNAELQAQDEWMGMEVECPLCKKSFTIIKETAVPTPVVELHSVSDKNADIKAKADMIFRKIKENKTKSLIIAASSLAIIFGLFLFFGCEQEVDNKDLISHNGKVYYLKLSNGLFSGVAISKEGDWVKAISHYKNGVRHGKTWYDGTGIEEEEHWKNGKRHGDYLCTFQYLVSNEILGTVKGQYKNGKKAGTWKYTFSGNDNTPAYEITWSYNDNGDLHGLCQSPLFPPNEAPYDLFIDRERLFNKYPAVRGFSATFAEAEFSGGGRVANGKLIKVTPTGKKVEISY